MKPVSIIAIYILFWTLTLFVALPFGVRTSREEGHEPVRGEADSAPVNPQMKTKLIWTTLISAVLFGIFWANYVFEWITIATPR